MKINFDHLSLLSNDKLYFDGVDDLKFVFSDYMNQYVEGRKKKKIIVMVTNTKLFLLRPKNH